MQPSRRSPRTTLCRRRVRFAGFALSRLRRERCQQTRQRLARSGGVGVKHQPALRVSRCCEAERQLCFRDITQHTLSVRSFLPHKFFSCRQLPALRDPSARNLCQTMWRCVLSRCFTVTLTANPHLRARAGSHRASSQASFTPTPPLPPTMNSRVCRRPMFARVARW